MTAFTGVARRIGLSTIRWFARRRERRNLANAAAMADVKRGSLQPQGACGIKRRGARGRQQHGAKGDGEHNPAADT